MPMRILYEAGVQATSEDITNRVRLYTLDVAQNSEEGSVAASSITIDDPNGDYDVVGWRRVRIYEDMAAGSNTLMYNGWVADRSVSRGPFVVTAGRIWETTLQDMNVIISMRVLNGTNANRPVETDVARINWLMSINEMNRIVETEYISSASPKSMDAVDYRGQTLIDVISDCAQQSGKNFFVYSKDNGVGNSITLGLWYDFSSSTTYSSPIRLSNLLSDVNNTFTFAMAEDTTLVRDPSRTYSGAYVRYDGGSVYEENITTSNVFTRRDAVYDASNVKNPTTATNRALRYLSQSDVEEDRIKTAFWVPAAKVNFVKPGMRVQIKATHLPGYEDWTWGRVVKHQIKEISEIDEATGIKYLVSLEMSATPTVAACSSLGYDVDGVYGAVYSSTATGFYPYNSTYGTSGDYVANGTEGRVFYTSSGGGGERLRPRTVLDASTGAAGGWHFADYGAAKAGMPTGFADGGAAIASTMKLQIFVLGPGTMTIWATSTGTGYAEVWKVNENVDPNLDGHALVSTTELTFPSTNVAVPNDGACLHYVLVHDRSVNANALYYGGHNWVAA